MDLSGHGTFWARILFALIFYLCMTNNNFSISTLDFYSLTILMSPLSSKDNIANRIATVFLSTDENLDNDQNILNIMRDCNFYNSKASLALNFT